VGGGAQYSIWDRYGATTLQGNLNKPDWDFVQTVVEDGARDNVRIERRQTITSHLQATLGGGFNHYSMQHVSNAADAAAWGLNVAYAHPYALPEKPGDEVMLGAYYTVDAEYFEHVERRTVNGNTFKPLPANSYEIHALDASISKNISSQLYAEG